MYLVDTGRMIFPQIRLFVMYLNLRGISWHKRIRILSSILFATMKEIVKVCWINWFGMKVEIF